MSGVLSAIKDFIATYPGLAAGAPLWVDSIGDEPPQYAIVPLPGPAWTARDIVGGGTRDFQFAFQIMASTADDLTRIANNGFFEGLAAWLDTQTLAGNLPVLGTGKTPSEIKETAQPFLYQQGQSQTAIYQAQYTLTYEQDAP